MDRWVGKVALVTGASSGIGAEIAIDLANAGMIVVGAARRQERVNELKAKVLHAHKQNLHSFKCDVSKEEDIKLVFKWIDEKFGGIDVLINNAGIVKTTKIIDADNSDRIRETIDTNLTAAVFCSREAYHSMTKKGSDGHIILINSVAGHIVPYWVGMLPSLNIYPSTKFGLTAMTEVLRQELQIANSKIKVTSVSPGAVKTEIISADLVDKVKGMPFLESKDISDAVLYVLGTPPHVQVHELIIKPIGERI